MKTSSSEENRDKRNGSPVPAALILFALAVLYDISPVDVIPDVLPGVGWVDDFFVTVIATLNLMEKSLGNISASFAALVRFVKWGVVLIGIIAVALVGFGVYGVVKMVAGL